MSAGCASGEEPYSLAIALREALLNINGWDLEILGVDVNPAMLAKARRAHYTHWSLRATPEAIRARYFRVAGSEFVLDERVSRMVTFRAFNLADDDPTFSLACDAIFCRNVLMYFTPEVMRGVVTRLTDALVAAVRDLVADRVGDLAAVVADLDDVRAALAAAAGACRR